VGFFQKPGEEVMSGLPPKNLSPDGTPRGRSRKKMKEIEDISREDRSRSKDKYDDASVLQMLEDKEVEEMSKLVVAQTTNLKRQTRRLAESKEEIALKDAALILQTNELEEVKR
jgi:hypothetical protein